ncbi:MAG: DevR family CRISPR-associated autoregulator [Nitrososphaera sp.]|jgi:CRISPR-associated protein Cst2
MSNHPELTHIAGTFVIEAAASFLNGAGLGDGEDRNVTVPKTFQDGSHRVPYVSSQAWKRWLRNTLIEETKWPASELRALDVNDKGNTNKIGGEFNPVEFAEDDIFGYMRAEKGQGKKKKDEEDDEDEGPGKKVRSLLRASPFSASILVSLRKTGWRGRDEGFVHLKEGTPQPYTTEFYNTHMQAIFCLNYRRLGLYSNVGDRIELDESKAEEFVKKGVLIKREEKYRFLDDLKSGIVYEMKDRSKKKERGAELLKALARLRGGAKQAAYGTDVSPKVLIVAGLSCGNPIFNSLFSDDGNGPILKVDTLKEVVKDYVDRLTTPVFLGIRKGYLRNEHEVLALSGKQNGVEIVVTTPVDAAERMAALLPS